MRFRTTVELGGKTATGMRVPPAIIAGLGAGKKPAVRVMMRGHTYRTTVAPRGGEYLIPVSAENRSGAGVAAGDEVDVDIELDTEPREVAVPADFAAALAGDADASRFFAGLSYSQRQWFVLGIDSEDRRDQAAPHRQGARQAAIGPRLTLNPGAP
jgi:hypothetical protein